MKKINVSDTKVFVRIRPLLSKEESEKEVSITQQNEKTITVT